MAGFRLTPGRRAVIHALGTAERELTAGEVLAAARTRCPGLGRATVYRALRLLTRLGLALPVPAPGGIRYRLLTGDVHRLVCRGCGAESPLDLCLAQGMAAQLAERSGYLIAGHVLEFYGLCPDCRRRLNHED
ncbi:TPA: transcriptional repressor [Candidatus Bipolaricaulota bacterium]|nr:transcriptional repressor [Candidatus Bipolaricaulota bacterium]